MVKVDVSGKLFWGGEYAVVEPGYTAIIMEAGRKLRVTAEWSDSLGIIYSQMFSHQLLWWYQDGEALIPEDESYALVSTAVKVVSEYLSEQGKVLQNFDLNISSEMYSKDYQKYGLGSNGAVVVAVVRAMLELYDCRSDEMTVFKLACLVLLKRNSNGSMGDVACCTYGGLIAYTGFDRESIKNLLKEKSISELVEMHWNCLEIKKLSISCAVDVIICWTGQEADTSRYVDSIKRVKNTSEYADFIKTSQSLVLDFVRAVESGDVPLWTETVRRLRRNLLGLEQLADVVLETEKLRKMVEIAERFGAAAKFSGAGGGDCGLIFLFDESRKEELMKTLSKGGFLFL